MTVVMVREELTLKKSSRSVLTVRYRLESCVMPSKLDDIVKKEEGKKEQKIVTMFLQQTGRIIN